MKTTTNLSDKISRISLLCFFFLSFTLASRAGTYYWVGGSGNWSDYGHHWATSSGGQVFHVQVPTPNDTVYFDSLSFTGGPDTLRLDTAFLYCHTMSWNGVLHHPLVQSTNAMSVLRIYGSLSLDTGMTWNYYGRIRFESRDSSNVIRSAGQLFNILEFRGDTSASWTLLDSIHANLLFFQSGIFRSGDQLIRCASMTTDSSNHADLYLGHSLICTSTIEFSNGVHFLEADSTRILLYGSQFRGGDQHFGEVQFLYGADIMGSNSFRKALFLRDAIIHHSNTFDTLTWASGGTSLLLGGGTTQTITDSIRLNGACAGMTVIESASHGINASIVKTSGHVNCDYVILEDIVAGGGASFSATNSISQGATSGWTFSATPAPRNLWWINGSGNWSDTAHWSLASGGMGGNCAPNLQDNVYFDAAGLPSGTDSVLLDSYTSLCNDMDWSAAPGTPFFTANDPFYMQLRVYGSLLFTSGMHFYSPNMAFRSNASSNTINANGQHFGPTSFYGTGSWSLGSNLSTDAFYFSRGGFTSNNYQLDVSDFSVTDSYPANIQLGTSVIHAQSWRVSNSNLLMNAASTTINMNGLRFEDYAGQAYNDVTFSGDGILWTGSSFHNVIFNGDGSIEGSNSFNDLTFNSAGKTIRLGSAASQTINGNFVINASCGAYAELQSTLPGIAASIVKTAGNITISDIIMQDMNAGGGATFNALNSVSISNVNGWNVTPPPSNNFYWIGGSGNWSDPGHWSATSGGTPGTCVPTPLNNVFFDTNSFSQPFETVNIDLSNVYCNSMDWTGCDSALYLYLDRSANGMLQIFGSLAMGPHVIFMDDPTSFRSTHPGNTITTFGNSPGGISFDAPGEWTLQDPLTASSVLVDKGTFRSAGQAISCQSFSTTIGSVSTIDLDSSVVTTAFWGVDSTNVVDADSSFITVTDGRFISSGHHYNAVYLGGNALLQSNDTFHFVSCTGIAEVQGNNVFDTLFFNNAGQQIVFDAGTTQTINGALFVNASAASPVAFETNSPGHPADIIKANDTLCINFVNMRDIHASGGAQFYAGSLSTDVANNTGWTFLDCHPALSDVWPGDANDDLNADNNDILAIGIAYNHTGLPRSNANNSWTAQPAIDWNSMFVSTANVKHADCDGDGIVGQSDTTAISLNYGQTHPPRLMAPDSVQSANPVIYIDVPQTTVAAGSTLTLPIMFGTGSNPVTPVYGIAFTVNYNAGFITNASTDYTTSWLCPTGNNVHLEKYFYPQYNMDFGMSRIDHQDASGFGQIAALTFTLTNNASGIFKFWISDIKAITKDEVEVPVNGMMTYFSILTGIDEQGVNNELLVYPNPADGEFTIGDGRLNGERTEVVITDVTGKVVRKEIVENTTSAHFDLRTEAKGLYFVKATNSKGVYTAKVMVK